MVSAAHVRRGRSPKSASQVVQGVRRIAAVSGLLMATAVANADAPRVVEVLQVDLAFEPAVVEVAPGNVVRFIWTSGVHTVTAGSNCAPSGLFNVPLTAGSPVFEYTVPESGPKNISYLCLPHCTVMTGVITVVEPSLPSECPADLDGSGEVDLADLLALLGEWGPCPTGCAADLTDSGDVGLSDLLVLLAAWGPCRP